MVTLGYASLPIRRAVPAPPARAVPERASARPRAARRRASRPRGGDPARARGRLDDEPDWDGRRALASELIERWPDHPATDLARLTLAEGEGAEDSDVDEILRVMRTASDPRLRVGAVGHLQDLARSSAAA